MSKGLNAALAYSTELTKVMNHHPINLVLSFLRLSSNALSYSSSTSSYTESLLKWEMFFIRPFSYHSSNFFIIIFFLRRFSRSVIFAEGMSVAGISFILENPSQVLVFPILSFVACPKLESFLSYVGSFVVCAGVSNPNKFEANPDKLLRFFVVVD